jgi:hypothetical protein
MKAIADVILSIIVVSCPIIWVVSLARWDGKCPCDKSKCNECFFPCCNHDEERNNHD